LRDFGEASEQSGIWNRARDARWIRSLTFDPLLNFTLTRALGRGLSRNKAGEAHSKWLRPRHPDLGEGKG
jgi:hypothetical protein